MPALDGLRAVAIVLVVGWHVSPDFRSGMVGVDVFFVLSGFLITALIAGTIQAERFSRRRFYARRAIRLVPALLVTVVVFAPIGAVLMTGRTWVGAVAALLYVSPFVPKTIFGHTWSLAVEEWFYLLWPVVLGKFFRDHLTMRQAAALVGALAVAVQAGMMIAPGSLAARPSALLAGTALGLWWLDGGRFARPTAAVRAGMAMILVGGIVGAAVWPPLAFWLAVGGTVLAVGGVASGGRTVILQSRPLVAVGVVSYEWYLLHAPILLIANELWGVDSYWVVVPVSLALAFGLHYAIVPLQTRLRARLDGRPAVVAEGS